VQKWEYVRLTADARDPQKIEAIQGPIEGLIGRSSVSRLDMTDAANRLGQEGWELVGVVPITGVNHTSNFFLFFKRPKQ